MPLLAGELSNCLQQEGTGSFAFIMKKCNSLPAKTSREAGVAPQWGVTSLQGSYLETSLRS